MQAPLQVENDDPTLVRLAREGHRDAFVTLMRRYNQRVFRVARSILRDDAEAEDAAQGGWVLAYLHLHQFEGRSSFPTWLARIVAREALAKARRRRFVLAQEGGLEEEMDHEQRDPERSAANRQARAMLEEAIDALPEAFRAVFVLRAVEEMSVAETAQCLEIPEETVKTRLHRARRLLRESLSLRFQETASDVFAFAGHHCDRMVDRVLERLPETAGLPPSRR